MSELRVDTIKKADGTGSLSVPAESGTVVTTASPSLGRRNLIINGAMQVAQRGTQVTLIDGSGYRTCDRFKTTISSLGGWTCDQSTDAPSGFGKSFKMTCTSADASPASGDYCIIDSGLEGQNLQGIKKGASDAEEVTLSFWVKSNVTGTAVAVLQASANFVSLDYTINSADTWEYKTLTFPADTTESIADANNQGLLVRWILGVGSGWTSGTRSETWEAIDIANFAPDQTINVGSAVNNYWQITGVQLEVGSVATPFEHRSYGEELALCQRYYFRLGEDSASEYTQFGIGRAFSSSGGNAIVHFPVPMRAKPTLDHASAVAGDFDFSLSALPTAGAVPSSFTHMTVGMAGSFTSGGSIILGANAGTGGNAALEFIAEL